ncbi:MAG: HprK-related kinase A [Vicinamibacterales bacterium]
MLIREFSKQELTRRLRETGVHLVTGAFTIHVRASLPQFAAEFAHMYRDYPIDEPPGIDDARLAIEPTLMSFGQKARSLINGNPAFRPVPADRAYTLFETALNWSVALTDIAPMIMHAAVLERDGRALILPAPSGSGKSTLCAALASRGWRLLSDEMAIFGLDDARLRPNPRPISLKNNAVEVIRAFNPTAEMSRVYRGTPKGDIAFVRPPADAIARAQERVLPGVIVSPRYDKDAAEAIERLDRTKAFDLLAQNAVNYSSLLQAGFDMLTEIVERCDAYRLTYSDLERAVETIGRLHRETAVVVRS